MQAHLEDSATNRSVRPKFKHGVPTTIVAKKFNPSTMNLVAWEQSAKRSDFCFDLSENIGNYEAACRDPEHLAHAFGVMDAVAETTKHKPGAGFERALYLIQIEDDPIVKVGISSNPYRRLFDLQGAHYRELLLWGVIFTPTKKAMTLEQAVLAWATEQEIRLRGEWIVSEPAEVFGQIIQIAQAANIPICNAEIWLHNMLRRTKRIMAQTNMKKLQRRQSLRR